MDGVRGLAIVLVIAFHALTIGERFFPSPPGWLVFALNLFAPYRMPTLMFLSGLLVNRSIAKGASQYASGKLRRVAWPFLLWQAVFLAVSGALTLKTLLVMSFLPPTYLWYLQFLLIYYGLAWVGSRLHVPWWVIATIMLIGSTGPDEFRFSRFCYLGAFFFLGVGMYAHVQGFSLARRFKLAALSTASLITVAGSILSSIGVIGQYDTLTFAFPFALIALLLTISGPTKDAALGGSALSRIGKDSLIYYVTHFPVIWLVMGWLSATNSQLSFIVVWAVGIAAAMTVAITFSWLSRRSRVVSSLFVFPG